MTNRDWAHFLLFRQERQTKMDNGPERCVQQRRREEEHEELVMGQ